MDGAAGGAAGAPSTFNVTNLATKAAGGGPKILATGRVKRPHRGAYRAGAVELREMRMFQKSVGNWIPPSTFAELLAQQRGIRGPRGDPEVCRLLQLQSITAHRRDPPPQAAAPR